MICLLIEARQPEAPHRPDEIWDLISRIYVSHPHLADIHGDRRKTYAAELIVAAWKEREVHLLKRHQGSPVQHLPPQKPKFVAELESQLSKSGIHADPPRESAEQRPERGGQSFGFHEEAKAQTTEDQMSTGQAQTGLANAEEIIPSDFDFSAIPELNFEDIDWMFWDGPEESQQLDFALGGSHR